MRATATGINRAVIEPLRAGRRPAWYGPAPSTPVRPPRAMIGAGAGCAAIGGPDAACGPSSAAAARRACGRGRASPCCSCCWRWRPGAGAGATGLGSRPGPAPGTSRASTSRMRRRRRQALRRLRRSGATAHAAAGLLRPARRCPAPAGPGGGSARRPRRRSRTPPWCCRWATTGPVACSSGATGRLADERAGLSMTLLAGARGPRPRRAPEPGSSTVSGAARDPPRQPRGLDAKAEEATKTSSGPDGKDALTTPTRSRRWTTSASTAPPQIEASTTCDSTSSARTAKSARRWRRLPGGAAARTGDGLHGVTRRMPRAGAVAVDERRPPAGERRSRPAAAPDRAPPVAASGAWR